MWWWAAPYAIPFYVVCIGEMRPAMIVLAAAIAIAISHLRNPVMGGCGLLGSLLARLF
jgi:hypothetical protein